MSYPNAPYGSRDFWREQEEANFGRWMQRWMPSLDQHLDMRALLADGSSFALMTKQLGTGRRENLFKAIDKTDWATPPAVLAIAPPILLPHYDAQMIHHNVKGWTESTHAALAGSVRKQARLLAKMDAADLIVVEPNLGRQSKAALNLRKLLREANKQTITTAHVMFEGYRPPREADTALVMLSPLVNGKTVPVTWAEDLL